MRLLTIIITASLIPSHPKIKLIQETIESLQLINIPSDTEIILAHDYSDNNNYSDYLKNLNEYIKSYSNIKIVKRENHGHLTGNIRNALQYVDSKYILVIQHDLPFIKMIDIQKIIYDMEENNNIKYIRFGKTKAPTSWDNNNIKKIRFFKTKLKNIRKLDRLYGLQVKQKNYTYTRTPAWSDQNHLCLTLYYTNIVMKECPDGCFMERILHGKNKNEEIHNKYGTYLFGKLNDHLIIKHTDGRNTK